MVDENNTSLEHPEEPIEGSEPSPEEETGEEEQPSEETEEAGDVEPSKPRLYTQEEWSKRESAKDADTTKQLAQLRRELQETQARAAQTTAVQQSQGEYGQMLQQMAMQEAVEVKQLEDQGLDAMVVKRAYARERQALSLAYRTYLDQIAQQQTQRATNIRDLVWKYGLTEADIPTLLSLPDVAMEHAAKSIQLERRLNEQQVANAAGKKKPQEFSAPSGAASGGGDDALMRRYAAGESMSPKDHEKVREILDKYT